MKLDLLIVVTSDPRVSARPAEAIRIAAGISASKNLQLGVYLHGPATLAVGSETEDLVDSENFERYLPSLFEVPNRVMLQAGSPFVAEMTGPVGQIENIDEQQFAATVKASCTVLRF